MRLRAIRFTLSSGEEELLITNIVDENLGIPEFKTLYFKRWGIETKFDELKNKLQLQSLLVILLFLSNKTFMQLCFLQIWLL